MSEARAADEALARLAAALGPVDRGPPPPAPLAWDQIVPVLEAHGVLGLALARGLACDAGVPTAAKAAMRSRARAVAEDAARARLTIRTAVAALAARGLPAIVLKGGSLIEDVYPDPAFRALGDVDLLVRARDVRWACALAAEAGLVPADDQLPLAFDRLVHFHTKLRPATPLLKEVELHWRLQSPALLVGPPAASLWARAVAAAGLEGAFVLDPLDRYLHLATHLLSHWRRPRLPEGRALVAALLRSPAPAVRLKWIVDLAWAAELLPGKSPALRESARAWGAERQLALVARMMGETGLLGPRGEELLRGVMSGLAPRPAASTASSVSTVSVALPAAETPHPALGFRLGTLALFGRWLLPPPAVLSRRLGARGRAAVALGLAALPFHAVLVLARAALAALLLGPALIARRFLRRGRRRLRAAALRPDAALALAVRWREEVARISAPTGRSAAPDVRAALATPERPRSGSVP